MAIYDYKFTQPKTKKQEEVFSKQLPLEAALVEMGAFEALGARKCTHTEFIVLGKPNEDLEEPWNHEFAHYFEKAVEMLKGFETGALAFVPRLFPFKDDEESEYDHLARRGEWKDGDEPVQEHVG